MLAGRNGYAYGDKLGGTMLALGAAIVWLLTAPFIGAFDDPANGLYVGLALFAAHFAIDLAVPWPRR